MCLAERKPIFGLKHHVSGTIAFFGVFLFSIFWILFFIAIWHFCKYFVGFIIENPCPAIGPPFGKTFFSWKMCLFLYRSNIQHLTTGWTAAQYWSVSCCSCTTFPLSYSRHPALGSFMPSASFCDWWSPLNWITSKLQSVDVYYLLWTQQRAATLMADERASQWLCPRRTAWQWGLESSSYNSLWPPAGISHRLLSLLHKNVASMKRWAAEGEETFR